MEILEAMIKNENTEEEIEQWTENHRAAVAIYDAQIEKIKNSIITLREKEADDAEQEERRIQRRLEEERRILEIQMEVKKKEE